MNKFLAVILPTLFILKEVLNGWEYIFIIHMLFASTIGTCLPYLWFYEDKYIYTKKFLDKFTPENLK